MFAKFKKGERLREGRGKPCQCDGWPLLSDWTHLIFPSVLDHLVSRGWQNVQTLELNRKFWWSYWLHQVNRHCNIIKNPSRTQKCYNLLISYWELLILILAHMQCGHQIYYFLIYNLRNTLEHVTRCFPPECSSGWLESPDSVISGGVAILDISILEHSLATPRHTPHI